MRRAHSHGWLVRLYRGVSKGCAMDDMVLWSNFPYHRSTVRDERMCGGRICAHAGVHMATWCSGVCVRFPQCSYVAAREHVALYSEHCVRVILECTYHRILGFLRASVLMRCGRVVNMGTCVHVIALACV